VGVGKEKLGVLARSEEGGGDASGQRVMSVMRKTGFVVKLAKDIIEEVLLGPEWNIRSGFGRR
jgi:hypothetical protein